METQIFHHAKILLIFPKIQIPLKERNENPARYYNSIIITNQV
jgi:hypothetical protein